MFQRLFIYTLKKIGIRTLVAAFLLVTIFSSVAFGISNIVSGLHLNFLLIIGFFAMITSWIMAKSNIIVWISTPLIITIGIGCSILLGGDFLKPLYSFIKISISQLWGVLNYIPEIGIDNTAYNLALTEINNRISYMAEAISIWPNNVEDIVIKLIWGIIFWLTTSWLIWNFRRNHKPLIGVLPAGILMSTALAYTRSDSISLTPFLFASLLLLAYVNFDQAEFRWKNQRIDYPEDLHQDFSFLTTGTVTFIVLIASLVPAISFSKFIDLARNYSRPANYDTDPIIQSFGLDQQITEHSDLVGDASVGLPRSHLIGSGPELSENVVMVVSVIDEDNVNNPIFGNLPLYWRSLTYDEYLGSGWKSSEFYFREYQAGELVDVNETSFHHILSQEYRFIEGESKFLYAAGDILFVDKDFSAAYRTITGTVEKSSFHEDFFSAVINQPSYRVESMVPIIESDQLRSVSGEYPEWIVKRYLVLPQTIPKRVIDLAQEITSQEISVYDKALALEQFLQGYKYSLDIEKPDQKSDLVDAFLFDYQEGYCDYFASSMVVMARSLGIPARLVIGYSRGLFDGINNRFIVTEADAHTWVEIYFQEFGWIPFEPTAGRDTLIPSQVDDETVSKLLDPLKFEPDDSWLFAGTLKPGPFFIILVLMFLIICGFLIGEIRIISCSPNDTAIRLFQRLYRLGSGLSEQLNLDMTPVEFTNSLILYLEGSSTNTPLGRKIVSVIPEIYRFGDIYSQIVFSPVNLNYEQKKSIVKLWRQIRRKLIVVKLKKVFQFL